MHAIVDGFISSSERLSNIIEKNYDKNQFLESVFFNLTRLMTTKNVDNQVYFDIEQALVTGHKDTSIYLLFISFAIPFACIRQQLEKARVIHSIGSSVSIENIHPVLKSYYTIAVATLKSKEGALIECDQLIKNAIALIDKKSPRFITILSSICPLLAIQGRLKELDKEDLAYLDSFQNDEYRKFGYMDAKLINSIFTGNYKEGYVLLEDFKKRYKEKNASVIFKRIDILKLLSGDFNENSYREEFYKNYACACEALSAGNLGEVNKWIKIFSKNIDTRPYIPYMKYFALHNELSLKNKENGRLLLQELRQNDGYDYMEDLFLARIQLLEQNQEGANETFSRLIHNVNRYEAMGRLVFELQFAKEMKVTDILLLMNGLKSFEGGQFQLPINITQKANSINESEKGLKLLIGESQVIIQVKKLVKKFANLKEPVLITGETGTGKELLARAIHEEGPNSKEPFMAINCGALTETLLESELFGYEAGAFTGAQKERKGIFEAVGKGTVFLDEFGEISPKMQVSLLRVLESNEIRLIGGAKTRKVACKIVIATNIDLQKAVEDKKFREDLYFRLNRFDIKLPALRERPEDIPLLISYFLFDEKKSTGKQKVLTKNLLDALMSYRWPGNIRELKNEMERLKILQPEKEQLDIQDFDFSHLQDYAVGAPQKVEAVIKYPVSIPDKKPQIVSDRVVRIMQRGSKTQQRQELLKDLFREYKNLKRFQVMEISSISAATAAKDLETLCQTGFIEKRTPTNSVKSHYYAIVE